MTIIDAECRFKERQRSVRIDRAIDQERLRQKRLAVFGEAQERILEMSKAWIEAGLPAGEETE